MASFAASAYRLPGGSSRIPATQYSRNWHQRKSAANKVANNAAKVYFSARNNANKQKRNVSGGLVGYIKRRIPGRIGEQARKNRNNRLNKNLIKRVNNTKRNYHNKLRAWSRI